MKSAILPLLQCPNCGANLDFESKKHRDPEILEGRFTCAKCPSTFTLSNGVAFFDPGDFNAGTIQTQVSFTSKWQRIPDLYDENSFPLKFQRDWYHPPFTHRNTLEDVKGWINEFKMKALVIDTEEPSGISVLVQKTTGS